MIRKHLIRSLAVLSLGIATFALAADFGTSTEAKAMLEKVVAALKANQATALAMFTKGEGGFKDRDLYPYCGGPDGMFTAHPTLVGKSLKDLKDKSATPKPLGEEIYKSAQQGKISEVSYMWPRPGTTEPVQKVVFVTKVGDQVCAVGYYK
jgi:signal transduction histidine kinase